MNNIYTIKNTVSLILSLLLYGSIHAQEYSPQQCIGEKVKSIAEILYTDYQIDCENSTEAEIDKMAIIIRKNASKKILHIGFKLFPNKTIDKHPSPAYNFIEYYLLNLYLLKEDSIILRQMNEDKVQILFGNKTRKQHLRKQLAEAVSALNRNSSFTIDMTGNNYTMAYADDENKVFKIHFPANHQLLSGMNKKESEQFFYTSLTSFPGAPCIEDTVDARTLEKIGENCYLQKGETYQIEAMNTNRYYTLQNGNYLQLADTLQAGRSVQNLFTMQADNRIEANVTLRLYGQKKIDFSIPLHKLLEFCRANGCKVFAGIESAGASSIKGTAILLNQAQGYSHTMSFEVDPRILNRPEAYKIKTDLYTFAPVHNIESIFFENQR
ncbi:conserved domain protein [Bacteroides fluxus YIT 12057]|uniref:Conserved domain protein n=2 Tax=Bacteroides fluxus TaxID=626930 RepID=F3PWS3_9BACE|nr:conserved domain protein [Bacteroides fluxus YIT 12057]